MACVAAGPDDYNRAGKFLLPGEITTGITPSCRGSIRDDTNKSKSIGSLMSEGMYTDIQWQAGQGSYQDNFR